MTIWISWALVFLWVLLWRQDFEERILCLSVWVLVFQMILNSLRVYLWCCDLWRELCRDNGKHIKNLEPHLNAVLPPSHGGWPCFMEAGSQLPQSLSLVLLFSHRLFLPSTTDCFLSLYEPGQRRTMLCLHALCNKSQSEAPRSRHLLETACDIWVFFYPNKGNSTVNSEQVWTAWEEE